MNREFQVHRLNGVGQVKARKIAELFDGLLGELVATGDLCPPGTRETILARQKLEEAAFYFKKSMASVAENLEELVVG